MLPVLCKTADRSSLVIVDLTADAANLNRTISEISTHYSVIFIYCDPYVVMAFSALTLLVICLDFTEARDSEWQWHQLDHMQVCTSLQTDNHASTPPLSFLQAGYPSCRPANSIKALKARLHSHTRTGNHSK